MKEVQINGVDYLLVEVPEESFSHRIEMRTLTKYVSALLPELVNGKWNRLFESKNLPEGHFELICKASDISEKGWQQIVENEFDTWLNYLEDEKLGSYYLTTAKESGYSLLELHGFKPETTLILKRKA